MPALPFQPTVTDTSLDTWPLLKDVKTRNYHTQSTLGDAHGNTIKLIHFLIRDGVLQLWKGYQDYQDLLTIYNKDVEKLTKADLKNFNSIIKNATVSNLGMVRLLGDELVDRGQNDYFTLKVLEKLGKSGVKTEIQCSNHGFEFLAAYARQCYNPEKNNTALFRGQNTSLTNLGELLVKGLVKESHIAPVNGWLDGC